MQQKGAMSALPYAGAAQNFIVGKKEHKIARIGVGRKFQSPRVFENLSVRENLEISVSQYSSPIKLIASDINKDKLAEIERLLIIAPTENDNNIMIIEYDTEDYYKKSEIAQGTCNRN